MAEAGLTFSEGLVFETTYSYPAGLKLAERVKASGATAAVVTDDEVAVGLLNGLVNSGVNVPEDFEIITANTYPSGEGAGFAGGIVSAGIDGLKCAESMIAEFAKPLMED